MNRKRIERLWRLEGHRVPPQRKKHGEKARGTALGAVWNTPATGPNHVWSYDFLATRTSDGGALRVLNVVDEYTRRGIGCRVERHIGARDVVAELEMLFKKDGKPAFIRSDNGREVIAESTRGASLATPAPGNGGVVPNSSPTPHLRHCSASGPPTAGTTPTRSNRDRGCTMYPG